MSQHVYTLKFTISIHNPEGGLYPIQGEVRERKPELLSDVVGPDGATKEDVIREKLEKKIEEILNVQQGIISVKFDSLIES